jgi:hypothetical protein
MPELRDSGLSDWGEYRRLILSELDRIGSETKAANKKIDDLQGQDLAQIKTDLALLKFQAGMWGGVGGIIFGTIMTFILKLLVR